MSKRKIPSYIQDVIVENLKRYGKKEKIYLFDSTNTIYTKGFCDGALFCYGSGWNLTKIFKDIKKGSE